MEWQSNINNIINKYLEGNTSIDEENQLRSYFANNENVHEKHLTIKMMLDYYNSEKEIVSKVEIEDIIKHNTTKRRTLIISAISIAASILLVFTVALFHNKQTIEEKQVYAYVDGKAITDEKVAMLKTQQALLTISKNLNQGTQNLSYLQKINKANDIIRLGNKEK